MIKILNEEKGSGLILILIVMMLMTVLGTTALYSMGTEGKQATLHNYKTQAYYLARSGVEIGQQWLKNKEFNIAGVVYLSGDLGGNFVEASDSSKAVNITITESGNIYTIKATGQHNGQKEVVSLEIKNTSESSFPTGNNALYVSNSITFSGSTRILGSVATDFNSPTQIAFNSSGGQYISGDVYIY
ncbi:hypothetical protein HYG86_15740 [Alkalicella caledoniensis]|uniref:Type 4 fimbrial biogenesis protein PilX N-terminal domain-containing protein n=1 Tax=Alkalicella caledoniensis TaxID=2731377 RepID=A0A7G9WBQ4_ALKCA|nr:hypothetical protein [Alkalicella caledoniensis]QNO16116.1 hypothetical protein HYG86_15740 [Alkalicella caledoniensis]